MVKLRAKRAAVRAAFSVVSAAALSSFAAADFSTPAAAPPIIRPCYDPQAIAQEQTLSMQVQQLSAQISQREQMRGSLQVKRAAVVAAIAAGGTPDEQIKRQNELAGIDADIAAADSADASDQAMLGSANAEIMRLRSLPPC